MITRFVNSRMRFHFVTAADAPLSENTRPIKHIEAFTLYRPDLQMKKQSHSSKRIQASPIPKQTAGAVAGATLGSVAGPIGAVVGGVVGALAGDAVAGRQAARKRSRAASKKSRNRLRAKPAKSKKTRKSSTAKSGKRTVSISRGRRKGRSRRATSR